jgi:hypothetical protein
MDASSDSDSDAPPEVITSKAPPGVVDHGTEEVLDPALEIDLPVRNKPEAPDAPVVIRVNNDSVKPVHIPRPVQPKKAPYNPFASRPTLLRNVSSLVAAYPCLLMAIISCFFLKYGLLYQICRKLFGF